MLSLRIEKLRDVTIIHCAGRIVFPDVRELRIVLLRQLRTRSLVLDLVNIAAIDAAGLGMLVSLRRSAKQTGRILKLMNVTPWVERLLQLTKLKSEFEICSAREMLDLLCRAMQVSELVHSETAIEDSELAVQGQSPTSRAAA
jgi:anti-anti-sigma factor